MLSAVGTLEPCNLAYRSREMVGSDQSGNISDPTTSRPTIPKGRSIVEKHVFHLLDRGSSRKN
jgi:hypothetical protein